ncbi:MAG: HEAT repeat domain-containing protein [Verrucomicrobia bacterium]|nr:HEAT repeat domain-containing protein [Verrucomicrobiota bacterium]
MQTILRLTLLTALGVLCAPLRAADAGPGLPKCPPDWKVELIAESPVVRYPSVVCCAPDGRIFVGEDYMDGKNTGGETPIDRVLCFHPDGTVTVFAEDLYAVFGLQYLDGKLFVHHAPKFSVFDDHNGVGANRKDLFHCTNSKPWLPSLNDHIPSGFRLAMDGYFYLCTGDKGIHGMTGPDGRKVDLRGGIMRMRPDATGAEVFSRGTRNFLDTAMTAEDEMFTLDNSDDGQGWWTRLSHMVDGGDYGYPYDYKTRQPHTLWMMADYGGGGPTGAAAYNEDALPAEYRGNLFFGEWSKRQISRVRVERDGASFRVLTNENFFSVGEKDFRPVGITFTPDGLSLVVADWHHHHWKENSEKGRLLKFTYTGPSQAAPRPDWFVSAAMGRAEGVSTAKLIQGLRHSAQAVRLVAQRRLAERKDAIRPLKSLLTDRKAPPAARWHAIWALDALDGGKAARRELLATLNDADLSVRAQAIRQAGGRGVKDARKPLEKMLAHPNAAVRFQSATALGRIGDPASVPALLEVLDEKDLFARYAVFTALNRIGRAEPRAWAAITKGLEHKKPAVREGTFFALRESYFEPVVQALSNFAAKKAALIETRQFALAFVAGLARAPAPWDGSWWSTTPAGSPRPRDTNEWSGTPLAFEALRAALHDGSAAVRRAAVDGIRTADDSGAGADLGELFARETDTSLKKTVLETLRDIKAVPQSEAIVTAILNDTAANSELTPEALVTAGRIGGTNMIELILRVAQGSPPPIFKTKALEALGAARATNAIALLTGQLSSPNASDRQAAGGSLAKIGGEPVAATLTPVLTRATRVVPPTEPSPPAADAEARKQAVELLGQMKLKSAVEPLLHAYADPVTRDEAALALAAMPDVRAVHVYLEGLQSPNVKVHSHSANAIRRIQAEALPKIEAHVRATRLPAAVLSELRGIYGGNVTARRGPIFSGTSPGKVQMKHEDFALANPGDATGGRMIFNDRAGVACIKCHRVAGEGGDAGPDLSGIGLKYSRAQLIEEVTFPSRSVLDGYRQTMVVLRGDDLKTGIVRQETATELTLVDTEGKIVTLQKSEVQSTRSSPLSLMPDGLHLGLTAPQFADLIAYLETLKDGTGKVSPAAK